jgi:hypothetical protein
MQKHQLSGYNESEINGNGHVNKLLNNSFTCDNFRSHPNAAYKCGPSNPQNKHHEQRKNMSVTAYHRLQNLKPQIQGKFFYSFWQKYITLYFDEVLIINTAKSIMNKNINGQVHWGLSKLRYNIGWGFWLYLRV